MLWNREKLLELIIINNNKTNILRGGLQSPNGGFQEGPLELEMFLRWLNTVFARSLAHTIQRAHKDCIKQTWSQYSDHFICSMSALSALFFFIIEHKVLMVFLFYYQGMLEKVTM